MQEAFKIESSHLTYHLENLGDLLFKTEDGKYALSSFGEAATSMMYRVEETPKTPPRFPSLPTTWKAFIAVLMVGIVLSSVLYYVQYQTLGQLSADYESVRTEVERLGNDYERIEADFEQLEDEYNRTKVEADQLQNLLDEYLRPTPRFTYSLFGNQSVTFDASLSLPGHNKTHVWYIIGYAWDFGDGNITSMSTPFVGHTYRTNGTYNVTLNVTDSRGFWDTVSKTIRTVQTTVYVNPPITTVNLGEEIVVHVKIRDFAFLKYYSIELSWTPDLLECTDAATPAEHFYSPVGEPSTYINNTEGYVIVSLNYYDPLTADGDTELATNWIWFNATAYGSSDLHISQVNLIDSSGNPIPCDVIDGFVEVKP